MSAEYSVEEVLESARKAAASNGRAKEASMLFAYAERIKADEGAVPVAYANVHHFKQVNDGFLAMRKPSEFHNVPLFTHPPAQVAQVEDWRIGMFERWREAAQEKGYAGIAEAITAAPTAEPVVQVDPGWPAPFEVVQTWALANGYSGATDAEACKAYREAHPAEPVAQGEAAWLERLKDPATVHALMLRGVIAIPSIRSMVDLRGEVPNGEEVQLLRIAELQEQLAAQPRAVPDGWKAVTSALVSAAELMISEIDTCGHEVDPAYRLHLYEAKDAAKALLTAAPSPGESA